MLMRSVGMGVLGLVGGLLFGIVVQDILGRLLGDPAGTPSVVVGLVFGSLLPACLVLGPVVAIWIDRRQHRRRTERSIDE